MKQKIFTLVMMFALMIFAGKAMAQTKSTPYRGGTYTYNVAGIVVQTAGTGTIEYLNASNAPLAGATITVNSGFTGTGPSYGVATGGIALEFSVLWSNTVTAGKIRVTVTDGAATGGCTNFIEMEITPVPLPEFAIAISANQTDFCQATTSTPANVTAASSGQTNTIVVTVTPDVSNLTSDYTYTYDIDISTTAALTSYAIVHTSGSGIPGTMTSGIFTVTGSILAGADPTPDVFTITFTTTTGIAPVTIAGDVSDASITVAAAGSTVYNATDATQAIIVRTMPSIGVFN